MPGPIYGIPSLDQVPAPVGNVSFNSFRGTNLAEPTNAQDITSKNYVDQAISAISQNTGSQVISGCGVAWTGTGLQFLVSAGTYSINGVTYSVAQTIVTLDAADGSNPRIDLIIVDTTSIATKITGTPAESPVAPSVDPATQLQLTFVYVAAGATTPGVTNTLLYDENVGAATEWNSSSSGATWSLGSTNNPYSGSKDIEATSVGTNAYAQLQKGSGTIDPSTQNQLVFYIRSKATWGNNRSLTIAFLNGGVQVGNGVSLRDGIFGFSSSNTTSYQQIVIQVSAFGLGSSAVNQIRFIVAGSGGSIGFYLDLIQLQSGVTPASQNFMVARGAWNSANAYARNDVVVYNGETYVCLVANSNSAPTETGTNWQPYSSITDLRVLTASYTLPGNSSKVYVDKIQIPAGVSLTIPGTSAIEVLGPGSASTMILAAPPGVNYNVATLSYLQILGLTTPNLSAGDTLTLEIWMSILNNSGGGRTYFVQFNFGGVAIIDGQFTTAFGASATNRCPFRMKFIMSIVSSSLWYGYFENDNPAGGQSVAGGGITSGSTQLGWNTGANNFTGAQALTVKTKSDSIAGTSQTLTLHSYELKRKPQQFS